LAETPKAPETTPVGNWLVPNQDKFEQVVDARLAAHAAGEKTVRSTSRSSSSSKDADK
jgi:hypothetical protein